MRSGAWRTFDKDRRLVSLITFWSEIEWLRVCVFIKFSLSLDFRTARALLSPSFTQRQIENCSSSSPPDASYFPQFDALRMPPGFPMNITPPSLALRLTYSARCIALAVETLRIISSLPAASRESWIDFKRCIFVAGYRRVDGRVSDVRLWGAARVRAGQLRVAVRRSPRKDEEATQAVGGRAPGGARRHGRRRPARRPQLLRHGKGPYFLFVLFVQFPARRILHTRRKKSTRNADISAALGQNVTLR